MGVQYVMRVGWDAVCYKDGVGEQYVITMGWGCSML